MDRSESAKKAWKTRNANAAGRKAALAKSRKAAAKKAAATRKRRSAARKAAATRKAKLAAKNDGEAAPGPKIGLVSGDDSAAALSRAVRLIESHFHALIRHRVVDEGRLRLPKSLPHVDVAATARSWFAVPGMAGGFAFEWDRASPQPLLTVSSWSRMVTGSGQRHHVTARGVRLVDEGFV